MLERSLDLGEGLEAAGLEVGQRGSGSLDASIRKFGGGVIARRLIACVVLVLLSGGCGSGSTQTALDGQGFSDCDELSDEAAELVVAVADHAATDGGGLPAAALEAEHPEDLSAWELAAALADGSGDLEARVESARDAADRLGCPRAALHETIDRRVQDELLERGEQLSEDFDRDQHAAMNLMAIASAAFQPPPSSSIELPPGFPAEFPVHPDAEQIDAEVHQDGSVSATWQVDAPFDVVADFYLDALQEGRSGGWDVGSSQGSQTQDEAGTSTGRQRLEITGYNFAGEVQVISENPGRTTIAAELSPQE